MFRAFAIFGWVLLALAGIYVSFAAYFHMGSPQPSVDYLADFNKGIEQAEEDDLAWPIYRPLWKKHGFADGGGFRVKELYHYEDDNGVMVMKGMKRPGDEGWDSAVARLEDISDLLDGFREARFKPRLGVALHSDKTRYSREDFEVIFPGQDYDNPQPNFNGELYDENVVEIMKDSALHILLPHIQPMRNAARILTADTRWAIEQGDSERVVANLETILGIGRQASDSNNLVGSLVGFAVGGIGVNLLEEVLTEHPEFLNEEQLARLQTAFNNENITDWMNIGGERAFIHDTIQRVYTDDGDGGGRITATGVKVMNFVTNNYISKSVVPLEEEKYLKAAMYVAAPASLFVVAGRKETTELAQRFLQQYEDLVDIPYWESKGDDTEIDEFLDANAHRHFLLAHLLPAFQQVRMSMVRLIARKEAAVVAIASQRHFFKYGTWPNSFDQLSPEFVTEFPIDQMNGKFLNIKAEENGVLIYSVGHDLDDDGGVLQSYGRRYRDHRGNLTNSPNFFVGGDSNPKDFDADWILWPQADWKSRVPEHVEEK